MTNKHTPGPWKIRLFDLERTPMYVKAGADSGLAAKEWFTQSWDVISRKHNDKAITKVEFCTSNLAWGALTDSSEALANAHLITAAPELLDALEEVILLSDRDHNAWNKAKAAIKKAKGE